MLISGIWESNNVSFEASPLTSDASSLTRLAKRVVLPACRTSCADRCFPFELILLKVSFISSDEADLNIVIGKGYEMNADTCSCETYLMLSPVLGLNFPASI